MTHIQSIAHRFTAAVSVYSTPLIPFKIFALMIHSKYKGEYIFSDVTATHECSCSITIYYFVRILQTDYLSL